MKKVLVDAYLALNFGDDLFLKILFDRYPNLNFEIISGNTKYIDIFKNYSNVKVNNSIVTRLKSKYFPNLLAYNYDGYINIGGSIFMETSDWKSLYKRRKFIINAFSKKNKSTFILGSNFGPYFKDDFKNLYYNLFSSLTDICFREQYSYELFEHLPNVRLQPDIVFGLNHKPKLKIINSLGISLIDLTEKEDLLTYEDDYLNKIKEIIEYGLEKDMNITLFSFCEKQGDLRSIDKVLNLINNNKKNKIEVLNYNGNINYYLDRFSSMEMIIGTRFHACILSQVFNQDLYPIIYSNKTYNVLKDINLDNHYTFIKDIKSLDVEYLFTHIKGNKIENSKLVVDAYAQFEGIDKYAK